MPQRPLNESSHPLLSWNVLPTLLCLTDCQPRGATGSARQDVPAPSSRPCRALCVLGFVSLCCSADTRSRAGAVPRVTVNFLPPA